MEEIINLSLRVDKAIAEYTAKVGKPPAGLILAPDPLIIGVQEFRGVTVLVSPYCPPDDIYLINQATLDLWRGLGVL